MSLSLVPFLLLMVACSPHTETNSVPIDAPTTEPEVQTEPVMILEVALPAGTSPVGTTDITGIERDEILSQWAASLLPLEDYLRALSVSLGDRFTRQGDRAIWESSSDETAWTIEVFDPESTTAVDRLPDLPPGTQSLILVNLYREIPCERIGSIRPVFKLRLLSNRLPSR
jgi:hypothetical protein